MTPAGGFLVGGGRNALGCVARAVFGVRWDAGAGFGRESAVGRGVLWARGFPACSTLQPRQEIVGFWKHECCVFSPGWLGFCGICRIGGSPSAVGRGGGESGGGRGRLSA
jgi:hypothetical protein